MRALVSTARNIRLILLSEENVLEPEIEVVLTVYGRHSEFVGASIVNAEKCETIRFSTSPDGARQFADRLVAWASEAENQIAQIEVKSTRENRTAE